MTAIADVPRQRAVSDRGAPRSPAPPPRGVRLRRAAATFGLLGLVASLLWFRGVPCAFARVTHMPCPGCGSTRAVLALLAGDLHGVLHNNPLGPIMAVLLGALGLQAIASMLTRGDLQAVGEGRVGSLLKRGVLVVAALEVVLWIARLFGALGGPVAV